MTALRTAAQQALEALELEMDTRRCKAAITALRAALAQQDEPDHETRAELAEQQVVQLAEERDHYRNLWQKAQEQAEPLNLSDPAVQKRLASQWGYVPAAAQAEPVEPVAWQCREHGDSEWFDCGKESYGINPRRYTYRALYTAPPQRKPLTEEEIYHATGHCGVSEYTAINIARAIEEASWEKNNGQA